MDGPELLAGEPHPGQGRSGGGLARGASAAGVSDPLPQLLCDPDSTGVTVCDGIIVLPPGMTVIQGNVHFTERLTDLGLELLDGRERPQDGMVDVLFSAGSKTRINLRLAPAPPPQTDSVRVEPGEPPVPVQCKLALVIEDFGMSGAQNTSLRFAELPGTFTAAVHPGLEEPETWAQRARDMGMEVVLSLPMEPKNYPTRDPGQYAVRVDHSGRHIRKLFKESLDRVGRVTGVKTYMGSLAIEDRDVMRPILEETRDRDLFFLDSTREQYSVAPSLGRDVGVPVLTLWKASFVDHQVQNSSAAIGIRLDDLVRHSLARGYGIGLIHARNATLQVLEERLPRLAREGVVVTGLSEVLDARRRDTHPTRDDQSDR